MKLKNSNFSPVLLTICLIIFATLCSLGMWQVKRLQEKNNYIKEVYDNLKKEPIIVTENIQELPIYSRVRLKGTVNSDKLLWLYRRHPAAKYQEGAYLLAPINYNNVHNTLTAIGWVNKINFDKVQQALKNQRDIEITGIVLESEQNNPLIPGNDSKNKIYFTLDIEGIGKDLGVDLGRVYIASFSNNITDLPILPITPTMMIKIKNDHLQYAVTWFSLAGLLIIFYILLVRKQIIFNK